MTVNFQSLLSKPMDSVKRPTAKPAGTYFGRIVGYKFDESKQKKTPLVKFEIGDMQPGPDIDAAQLVDAEGQPLDLTKWKPSTDFYLTDDSMYRLKDFLDSLGVSIEGRSFGEAIPEVKGRPVQMTVTMTPSDKEEGVFYNNISQISGPAEA